MSEPFTRFVLGLSVLVLGVHLGAAVYEAVVVAPLWTGNPPESVRGFNPIAEFAVEPLSYKLPAVAVLAVVSVGLLLIGIAKGAGRAWALLAGALGLVLVAVTIFYAFPILRRTIVTNGAGLTDDQIVEQVRAWLLWSRLRIGMLIIAWTLTIVALLQRYASPHKYFRSELRWK